MSLLHGVSFNNKGKLIWTKSLQDLQKFVEEILNLADGGWCCPGGGAKQFKSEDIDLRWSIHYVDLRMLKCFRK